MRMRKLALRRKLLEDEVLATRVLRPVFGHDGPDCVLACSRNMSLGDYACSYSRHTLRYNVRYGYS